MEKHASGFLTKSIQKLFKRFHLMIFFVFIVACLSFAVIMINKILTESSNTTGYTSSINAGSIDEATLMRLQALHTSDQTPQTPEVPEGRINPFAE